MSACVWRRTRKLLIKMKSFNCFFYLFHLFFPHHLSSCVREKGKLVFSMVKMCKLWCEWNGWNFLYRWRAEKKTAQSKHICGNEIIISFPAQKSARNCWHLDLFEESVKCMVSIDHQIKIHGDRIPNASFRCHLVWWSALIFTNKLIRKRKSLNWNPLWFGEKC